MLTSARRLRSQGPNEEIGLFADYRKAKPQIYTLEETNDIRRVDTKRKCSTLFHRLVSTTYEYRRKVIGHFLSYRSQEPAAGVVSNSSPSYLSLLVTSF